MLWAYGLTAVLLHGCRGGVEAFGLGMSPKWGPRGSNRLGCSPKMVVGGICPSTVPLVLAGLDTGVDVSGLPDVGAAASDLAGSVQSSLGSAADSLNSILDSASSAQDQAGDTIGGVISGLKSQVGELGAEALAPFQRLGESLASGVQEGLKGAQSSINEATTGATAQISGTLTENVGQPLQEMVGRLLSNFGISEQEVLEEQATLSNTVQQAVMTLEGIATPRNTFLAENIAVLPLWLAMIFAPEKPLTKAVMSGYITVVGVGLVYVWLTYEALQNPVALAGFSSGITDLGALTKGFSEEVSVATAWAHIVAQDLFVGRWVYLDGQKNKVFTGHSLAICFLFGPAGVISHLLTRALFGVIKWDVKDIMEAGMAPPTFSASGEATKVLAAARKEASGILSEAKHEGKSQAAAVLEAAERQALDILKGAEVEKAALLKSAATSNETKAAPSTVLETATAAPPKGATTPAAKVPSSSAGDDVAAEELDVASEAVMPPP